MAIDSGVSIKKMAWMWSIMAFNIRNHLKDRSIEKHCGWLGILTMEDKQALVDWILKMQHMGHYVFDVLKSG